MGTTQTVEGFLNCQLTDAGLHAPEERAAVLTGLKLRKELTHIKWGDATEGYPAFLLSGLWKAAKGETVRWMDKNAPDHFARPLFADEPDQPQGSLAPA